MGTIARGLGPIARGVAPIARGVRPIATTGLQRRVVDGRENLATDITSNLFGWILRVRVVLTRIVAGGVDCLENLLSEQDQFTVFISPFDVIG